MVKFIATDKSKINNNDARKNKIRSQDVRSLTNFLKKVKTYDYANKESSIFLPKVHKIILNNKSKINFDCNKLKTKLRICKECDKWNDTNGFAQCSICQDNYHIKCLNEEVQGQFVCFLCVLGPNTMNRCLKCKKVVSTKQKKQCINCKFSYHMSCWKNRNKKCEKCCKKQKKRDVENTNKVDLLQTCTNQSKSTLFTFKQLIQNQQQQKKYQSTLQNAIKTKKMQYSQNLINIDQFQGIFSQNSLDFGINFMNLQQCKAYQQYKKSPIGPFVFNFNPDKGYDVIADKDIPQRSLICQYIGQVVTLRQCIYLEKQKKNDSLMELQTGKNADETLIIRPEKFTNIARFINHSIDSNVQSLKILFKGRPLVLLVAKKPIKKGKSLSYNYNAGEISSEYDTSSFF